MTFIHQLWEYLVDNHPLLVSSPLAQNVVVNSMTIIIYLVFLFIEWLDLNLFNRHSLRAEKPKWDDIVFCAKSSAIGVCFTWVPLIVLHFFVDFEATLQRNLPGPMQIAAEVILCTIVYDVTEYTTHRAMHSKYLYKYHKDHHMFNRPFALTTFAQHPLDLMLQTCAALVPILLACSNPISAFLFIVILAVHGIVGHCGYEDYRAFLTGGVIAGSSFHDMHHLAFSCNYGAFWSFMDRAFGTYREDHPKSPLFKKPSILAGHAVIE